MLGQTLSGHVDNFEGGFIVFNLGNMGIKGQLYNTGRVPYPEITQHGGNALTSRAMQILDGHLINPHEMVIKNLSGFPLPGSGQRKGN